MRIAFLMGPTCIGNRPFDFSAIETSPRGLTGTDGSFLGYARAMHQRGHDVTLYVDRARSCDWDGIPVKPYLYRREIDSTTDAACCWVDVHGLRWAPPCAVRLLNMQLNNFDFARGDWLSHVDVFAAPSQSLLDRLHGIASGVGSEWTVLPNGCDPGAYAAGVKVSGRCIYTSSPDRGLHVLLEQWPRIRAAVPHAHLQIFYHGLREWISRAAEMTKAREPAVREQARRAQAIERLLPTLDGVEYVGSVSRERMAREYSEAEVLAYPVDTISYTEGFASAILEGCAAGAVPVIADCDAIGEVYRDACLMVPGKAGEHANAWGDLAIRVLQDEVLRDDLVVRGKWLAAKHAWPVLAKRLEQVIVEAKAKKARAA